VIWLTAVIGGLVELGALLAVAEASTSRMSRVRALALRQEGRRNAALLERIQADPARYLNSIYLATMFAQNGSAILVALVVGHYVGNLGITVASVAFTLLYFVVAEAMAKTYAVLHPDRAALAVAPLVWVLGRLLAAPTRLLIGVANVLLPGKGLREGPFVTEHDIRSMAVFGEEAGGIEREERELIDSVFEFGDTVVREIMVPRPDIVAVEAGRPLAAVLDLVLERGFSRIPVYRADLDHVEGVVHAKDVLKALHQGRERLGPGELARPAHFVPESKRAAELLREMQQQKFHMAIVTDEYGSVSGLVTLEDLIEELVGEIADEYDREERRIEPAGEGAYRMHGGTPIHDLNELLGVHLPDDQWDTVGGLVLSLAGAVPEEGQQFEVNGLSFTAERLEGRRVARVLVRRLEPVETPRASGS
jgi:CBS domain containing-hemolysin-like protein